MEYKGKLYGKIGNKYFDTGRTSDEFDYYEAKQNAITCNLQNINASFLPKCTRVEVIDQSGRAYVNWRPTNKVQIQMQDDDKTLKIFIT